MPDKTPVEDAADDDIIDLLEVVKPGKPVTPESAENDDVDFSADLDSMLAELAKHETDDDPDQPFPDPTPVDHEVDPNEKLDLPSMEDLDHLLESLGATTKEDVQVEEVPTNQGDDLDAVSLEEKNGEVSADESESAPFTGTDITVETGATTETPQPAGEPLAPTSLLHGEQSLEHVVEQAEEAAGFEPPPASANGLEADVFDAFEAALAATDDEPETDRAIAEADDPALPDSGLSAPEASTPEEFASEAPVADAAATQTDGAASSDIPVDLDDLPFAKTAPPEDPFEAAMAADAEQSLDAETIAAALDEVGLPSDSPGDPFDAVIAQQGETAPDLSDPVDAARAAAEEMEELEAEATDAPDPLADDLAGDLPGDVQSDLSAFPATPEDDSPADPFEAALAADIAEERDAHIVAAAIDENGQLLVDPPADPFEAAMAQVEETAAPQASYRVTEENAGYFDTATAGQTEADKVAPKVGEPLNMEEHAEETAVDQTAGETAAMQDEATKHLEEVDLNELDALLDDMLSTAPPAGDQTTVPPAQAVKGNNMEERLRFLEERQASFHDTMETMRQKLLVSQGELVEQEMAPLQTALANAQALMTEIRQELSDKEAFIVKLKTTLEEQAGTLERLRSEVSAGENRYTALEERFTRLETDLDKKAAAAAAKVIREEIAALLQPEE